MPTSVRANAAKPSHDQNLKWVAAIPFKIPTYWTPERAFAVVELLDDLRDRIWAHYGVQLLDQYREQYGPADSDHTDDTTDNQSL